MPWQKIEFDVREMAYITGTAEALRRIHHPNMAAICLTHPACVAVLADVA